MEFEWDANKAELNLQKHKVSFVEAVESFSDPDGFVLQDIKHSIGENRYYWIGKTLSGEVLTTRFARRGGVIRIFGCANWREFREIYYEKTKFKES